MDATLLFAKTVPIFEVNEKKMWLKINFTEINKTTKAVKINLRLKKMCEIQLQIGLNVNWCVCNISFPKIFAFSEKDIVRNCKWYWLW